MTYFTKLLSSTIFSLIIGNGTIMAMEKKATHTLMICDTGRVARYATQGFHHHRQVPKNFSSTIKDPIIQCIITDLKTQKTSPALIAAKYLFIYNAKKPLLKLEIKQGKNKDNLNIMARCIKNPKLEGNTFLTQIKNAMKPLYEISYTTIFIVYTEQPDDLLFSPDSKQDFIKAGVAIQKEENGKTVWAHGPNGCPNEQALIKAQFTDLTLPKTPFIYWFLNNYQHDQQELLPEIKNQVAIALQLQPSTITIVK
jgi:hypothetical protein